MPVLPVDATLLICLKTGEFLICGVVALPFHPHPFDKLRAGPTLSHRGGGDYIGSNGVPHRRPALLNLLLEQLLAPLQPEGDLVGLSLRPWCGRVRRQEPGQSD